MRTSEPARRAARGATVALAAWASICIVAGCGAPITDITPEDAAARECLAQLEIPKAAKTLSEVDDRMKETYPADAWSDASEPFKPHYHRITDAEAFSWGYLKKLAADRSRLLMKTREDLAQMQRKAREEELKEAARKRKADVKLRKEAKRRATVKAGQTDGAAKPKPAAGGKKKPKKKATKKPATKK